MIVALTFAQYPVVSIYDIQYVLPSALGNCDDQTTYLGDTVIIRAKVVMDGNLAVPSGIGATDPHKNLWLQQGDGGAFKGIDLFNTSGTSVTEDPHNLLAGDSIEVVGVIEDYNGETEIVPLEGSSITILGQNQSIYPVVIDLSDLNDEDRNNKLQTGEQWEGTYIEIHGATVSSVDYFSGGSRVSFNIEDQFGNLANVSDRFTVQKLPGEGGTFVPPNVGDQLDTIRGIVAHSKNACPGFNGRGYSIYPFQASDYVYGAAAPRIFEIERSPLVPSSTDAVTVSADVTDNDGNVVSVVLAYSVGLSGSFTPVTMTNTGGDTYEATIPSQADGSLIRWYLTAVDDSSLVTTLPNSDPDVATYLYRVRNNGLSIFDIQYTPYSNGNSPYTGEVVSVEGVVTASTKANDTGDLGYVYIQQENQLNFAGIWLQQGSGLTALERGDKVEVEGTVAESFGMTAMTDISSISVTGSGSISPLVLNPDSFTVYNSTSHEPYEGMLVQMQSPTSNDPIYVVEKNADAATGNNYAEYRIGTDEFNLAGVRVIVGRQSGNSSLYVSYVNDSLWSTSNGNMQVRPYAVNAGDQMAHMKGILYYSFGDMKLLPRNNHDIADYAGTVYAAFESADDSACVNDSVEFLNMSSIIADQFAWEFGDGGTSSDENPMHAYTAPGFYSVKLTATNSVDNGSGDLTLTDVIYIDTVDCGLGIRHVVEMKDVSVYPNPADQWITVDADVEPGSSYTIRLYDLQGREVFKRITMRSPEQLSLDYFEAGSYILEVRGSGDEILGVQPVIKR